MDEEVYVRQPPGFMITGEEYKVYRLRKALYGLKQALRAWNKKIDSSLMDLGFQKCIDEYGVYTRATGTANLLIVCLYVDDLLITGSDEEEISHFKQSMMSEFEMTDLGKLNYFLGMEFLSTKKGIFMTQRKYMLLAS